MQRPFIIHISKQCIETLIRRPINAASDLGLHGLPMSHKKDVMLIWVKSKENSHLYELMYENSNNLAF